MAAAEDKKAGWCKLHSTPKPKATEPYGERGLCPGRALFTEMDVRYTAHDGSQHLIIGGQVRGKKAGCRSEDIHELWQGKGMMKKEKCIVA